jgi:hypothetical protein
VSHGSAPAAQGEWTHTIAARTSCDAADGTASGLACVHSLMSTWRVGRVLGLSLDVLLPLSRVLVRRRSS